LPSGDPITEVIIVLATFELVQECSVLVYSHSNFAFYLQAHMMLLAGRDEENMIRVEPNATDGYIVFSKAHTTSAAELTAFLDEMRKNKTLAIIDGV
jgi:hypothetical protein